MANREYVLRVLRQVDIFGDFDEAQIEEVADKFNLLEFEAGQPLFVDREPGEDFYIVIKGRIIINSGQDEGERKTLSPGDHFIEEELLYGQGEGAAITAAEPSELIHLSEFDFSQLILDYPQIKPWFTRNDESQWLLRKQNFKWVGEDELVIFVARKHVVLLVFNLVGPLIFFLAALAIISAVSFSEVSDTIWTSGAICSISLAFLSVLWGLWNWVDWGNDYYIVTNQRVVWVEKVIWLYESRDEAPLTTILAVNTTTTFLGRMLGYGSVIVKTFTGEITFRNLKDPKQMVAFVEEYRTRVQMGAVRKERGKIDQVIRERLGLGEDDYSEAPAEIVPLESAPGEEKKKQSAFGNFFKNFFTMRFEQDGVITYRKYWPTLFGKIWLPTLLILLTFLAMILLVNIFQSNLISAQTAEILFGLAILFILFVLIPWWIYKYADWRNDIYQVSDKNIVDIERKPLGTEVKKSAPVENILSLEHAREGLLGYMFNFGEVTINVGETQFVFRNVHDPARVQQDIFNRMYSLRRKKEKAEAAQQRQRFVDVLEVYHQNVEELEEDEYYDDYDEFDDDFGVELGSDGYP